MQYLRCISQLLHNEELYEKLTLAWADLYMNEMQAYLTRGDGLPHSEQTLFIRNSYTCESHRELMAAYYEAYCEGRLEGLEPYKEMLQRLQTGAVL